MVVEKAEEGKPNHTLSKPLVMSLLLKQVTCLHMRSKGKEILYLFSEICINTIHRMWCGHRGVGCYGIRELLLSHLTGYGWAHQKLSRNMNMRTACKVSGTWKGLQEVRRRILSVSTALGFYPQGSEEAPRGCTQQLGQLTLLSCWLQSGEQRDRIGTSSEA